MRSAWGDVVGMMTVVRGGVGVEGYGSSTLPSSSSFGFFRGCGGGAFSAAIG